MSKMKKILIVLVTLLLLSGCQSEEKKKAIEDFNTSVQRIESMNTELNQEIEKAEQMILLGEKPLDESLITILETTTSLSKAEIVEIPEMPRKLEDIVSLTNELNSVSFDEVLKKQRDAYDALDISIRQCKQVTNPSESFIIKRLNTIKAISGIDAATEDNDPNSHLHKQGGYTSDVFFSTSYLDQSKIYPYNGTIIEKGTDAGGSIEVYETIEEAESRNSYLGAFDGATGFSSGSHTVLETIVIRTSDELKASEQKELEQAIIEAFIRLD